MNRKYENKPHVSGDFCYGDCQVVSSLKTQFLIFTQHVFNLSVPSINGLNCTNKCIEQQLFPFFCKPSMHYVCVAPPALPLWGVGQCLGEMKTISCLRQLERQSTGPCLNDTQLRMCVSLCLSLCVCVCVCVCVCRCVCGERCARQEKQQRSSSV